MKFLSRNTAGLNQDRKLHQALGQARHHDVSFFQETKLQRAQTSVVRAKWRTNDIFMSCASTSRRGSLENFTPIVLTMDNVLFNHPPPMTPETVKFDLIDIIMLVKHVLYRLKFRDNLLVLPTLRLATVITVVDLERAVLVRNSLNRSASFMIIILDKLKTRAGF